MGVMTTGAPHLSRVLLGPEHDYDYDFGGNFANEEIEPEPIVIDDLAVEIPSDDDD